MENLDKDKILQYLQENIDSFPIERLSIDNITTTTRDEAKKIAITAIMETQTFSTFKERLDTLIEKNNLVMKFQSIGARDDLKRMSSQSEYAIDNLSSKTTVDISKPLKQIRDEAKRFNILHQNDKYVINVNLEEANFQELQKIDRYMQVKSTLNEFEKERWDLPMIDDEYSILQHNLSKLNDYLVWNNFDDEMFVYCSINSRKTETLHALYHEFNEKCGKIKKILNEYKNKKNYNFMMDLGIGDTMDVYEKKYEEIRQSYKSRLTEYSNIDNQLEALYNEINNTLIEYQKLIAPIKNIIIKYGIRNQALEEDLLEYFLYRLTKEIDKKENVYGFSKGISEESVDNLISKINHTIYYLTDDQEKAIKKSVELLNVQGTTNLLLQGDVSAGKTIVTIATMILLVEKGYKVCLIAPRKSLRLQHKKTIEDITSRLGFNFNIVEELNIENYKTFDILVKGYSFSDSIYDYANIDVCFMDEIQLFGVEQRNAVQNKFPNIDMIYTTATPHPRTKLITMLGDMDICSIKQMPPGRKPKITKTFTEYPDELDDLIHGIVAKKEMVIVICPMINGIGHTPYQSLHPAFEFYTSRYPDLRVEKMFGAQTDKTKDETLMKCNNGEVDILIATKVIEVGVDIPSASLIIIHYPHSQKITWGMSQLHQLRGRVGRKRQQAYCYIEVPYGFNFDDESPINSVLNTEDVFLLTENDFNWRGFESLIGVQQTATSKKDQQIKIQAYQQIAEEIPNLISLIDPKFLGSIYDKLKQRKVANLN